MARLRTAVFISGRGSNLRALLEAAADPAYPAEIAVVVSDRANAGGLAHADAFGVPTAVVQRRDHADKAAFEAALDRAARDQGAEAVCLAGFMRLLSGEFCARWGDRLLNIHPSLLPAFPGLDTHARALAAGVRIAGCTVHLVRPAVDSGPILVQAAVPVLTGDDEAALAARVLAAEHRIYPMALAWLAEGRVRLTVRRLDGGAVPPEEASSEAVEIAGAGSPFTVGRPPVLIVPGGSRSDAD